MKIIFLLESVIISLLQPEVIHCQEKYDSLLVFVGEKISLVNYPDSTYKDTLVTDGDTIVTVHMAMDARFVATYKVIQLINGKYTHDTISFIVYDHYGQPAFSNFQFVLLFVKPMEGKYYHEKYQYFTVYQTKYGEWASPYSSFEYHHPYSNTFTVKPEKIQFEDEISFDIAGLPKKRIKYLYPKPYYRIVGDKAIVVYGNYIQDLFLIKQQGILKARGFN